MLKLTTGVGWRAREVKDDIVIARGVEVVDVVLSFRGRDGVGDGSVDVQTTTG